MISRYLYKDPIFKTNTRYPNLRIENNNSILTLFRLVSGTINCIDQYHGNEYQFRFNYTNRPIKKNEKLKHSVVLENFENDVKLKDLDNYFKRSKFNSEFYSSINAELIKCLIADKENKHLEAFFYLYRVLEGICYTIPLIYVSKQKKYNKTYKELQSFFGNQKDGELAFFKRFIKDTYKEEDFYGVPFQINLLEIEIEELHENYFNLYKDKINEENIIEINEYNEIKVTFIGFYEFMINLRNRFFHFNKGSWQDNYSSLEILFPDYFFKPIVKHGINWISLILFEIIKVDFEKGIN